MSGWSDLQIWAIIGALGLGTWLLRFSFLGLVGARQLPEWVLRHLRYTAVGVIPALIAPLVVWPRATDYEVDPLRLAAAVVAIVVGFVFRSALGAITAGMGSFYALSAIF